MFTADNCLRRMYSSPYLMPDPGDGKIIFADRQHGICEMTSGASAETRTLQNPTKAGIRLVLRLLTDGGGDIVVTAANGFNTALETGATFADAGDMLSLISVSLVAHSTYRWQVLNPQDGVGIATATATSTSTATATATGTSTPTSTATSSTTASATTSTSKSTTATETQTVTATGSGTKTDSPTATGTRTATDTQTATSTQTQTPSATSTGTSTSTSTSTATGTSTSTATATGTQ